MPIALARGKIPDKPVWHCVVRAAPGDPDLGGGAWQAIAAELMHRTGLSEYGKQDQGVRWVAVHHGDNHIHIVATLARMDGRPVRLRGDWYRIGEAMAWAEKQYGLTPVARAGPRGTAGRRATRAEHEKAAREHARACRAGRPAPARDQLRRHVEAAAAAARTEAEFFASSRPAASRSASAMARSARARSPATPSACSTTGTRGGPVWFSGGQARGRPDPAQAARPLGCRPGGPGRLTGRGMSDPPARAVLAREALRAARAARTEPEFFAQLDRAGLLVRLRPAPDRPGRPAGWSLTLPGLADPAGQPVWFDGARWTGPRGSGELRARWAVGRPGAAPARTCSTAPARPDLRARGSRRRAGRRAAGRPGRAAGRRRLGRRRPDDRRRPGHRQRRAAPAADGFRRAARAPWGRAPAPCPAGAILRTAAYLLAGCAPVDRRAAVRRALIAALAVLAGAVTQMRQTQMRSNKPAGSAKNRPARPATPTAGSVRTSSAASSSRQPARPPAGSPRPAAPPGAPIRLPSPRPPRTWPPPAPGRSGQSPPPGAGRPGPADPAGISRASRVADAPGLPAGSCHAILGTIRRMDEEAAGGRRGRRGLRPVRRGPAGQDRGRAAAAVLRGDVPVGGPPGADPASSGPLLAARRRGALSCACGRRLV